MRILTISIISAVFLCLLGVPASAQDWLVATVTDRCSVTDIDFSDGLHGFAVGSFNCGLLTDDGGLTWQSVDVVPQQGQTLVWGHATSTDELWAARNDLYYSSDRGLNWTQVGDLSGSNGSIMDLVAPTPGHMIMIKGGQIQASDDDGEHWEVVYPGEFGVSFDELHFPSSSVGYATGGWGSANTGNVIKTTDGGQTWTMLTFSSGTIAAADFIDTQNGLVATQSSDVLTTSDGGASWHRQSDLHGQYASDIVHRGNDHFYAATTSGCVLESLDHGQTWAATFCDSQHRALSALSARGSAVVAAGNGGLVVYEDKIFKDDFDLVEP